MLNMYSVTKGSGVVEGAFESPITVNSLLFVEDRALRITPSEIVQFKG